MDIEHFLHRHGYLALFILLLLDEAGIPSPVPTDWLIVLSGYLIRTGVFNPLETFVVLQAAANIGASVLFWVVRQGGRPLIDRYGRYVHLTPERLLQSERWIGRWGWWGIALARALPGIRYAAVIACGLFRVSYWRFLTAQVVGTSLNMLVFLLLGWYFGPKVIGYLHVPQLWVLALVLGALALPAAAVYLYRRSGGREQPIIGPVSRRRALAADTLAGFAGAGEVAAVWSAATIGGGLLTGARYLSAGEALAAWLAGRGFHAITAFILIYLLLVALCIGASLLLHELALTRHLAPLWRACILGLSSVAVAGLGLGLALSGRPPPRLVEWWQLNAPVAIAALLVGLAGYAVVAVYGRSLAIRSLPPMGRGPRAGAAPTASPAPPEPVEAASRE